MDGSSRETIFERPLTSCDRVSPTRDTRQAAISSSPSSYSYAGGQIDHNNANGGPQRSRADIKRQPSILRASQSMGQAQQQQQQQPLQVGERKLDAAPAARGQPTASVSTKTAIPTAQCANQQATQLASSSSLQVVSQQQAIQQQQLQKNHAQHRASGGELSCATDPQNPYPQYAPITFLYLRQNARPRSWCLEIVSNKYPTPFKGPKFKNWIGTSG